VSKCKKYKMGKEEEAGKAILQINIEINEKKNTEV
jgi:hypothetical protein